MGHRATAIQTVNTCTQTTPPEEKRAFINKHCAGYSHVRSISTDTQEILSQTQDSH